MSVAGPLVPRPAWPLAGAGGDDDPAFPTGRRLMSVHEADVEPINQMVLQYACEACKLGFKSVDSARAHHGARNQPGMFVRVVLDPRYRHALVECYTPAQVNAALRAFLLHGP